MTGRSSRGRSLVWWTRVYHASGWETSQPPCLSGTPDGSGRRAERIAGRHASCPGPRQGGEPLSSDVHQTRASGTQHSIGGAGPTPRGRRVQQRSSMASATWRRADWKSSSSRSFLAELMIHNTTRQFSGVYGLLLSMRSIDGMNACRRWPRTKGSPVTSHTPASLCSTHSRVSVQLNPLFFPLCIAYVSSDLAGFCCFQSFFKTPKHCLH